MKIKEGELEFLGHSGFLITTAKGKKIAIDPYNVSEKVPKADLILITHVHHDHCSIQDIKKISKKGTTIITPADAQSKITKVNDVRMEIIEVGDEIKWNDIKIEAIPAYNPEKEFHPKKEGWMGFVIKMKETIIYHAGDTDKIPEMEKLTGYGKHGNEFITLLPVSGHYVMDSNEAAEVAEILSPHLAIPMHYGAGVAGTIEDAEKFVELCHNKKINAKILEKL